MLTEEQIIKAYKFKQEGKTFRQITEAIGLDPKTQHSQVVNALRYFVMGYQAARRRIQNAPKGQANWTERIICFATGAVYFAAIAAIVLLC